MARVIAGTATNRAVAVGAASTRLLNANADRLGAVLVNMSAEDVDLALGEAAVLGQGITLVKNGGYFAWSDGSWVGTVDAIAAVGPADVRVVELGV